MLPSEQAEPGAAFLRRAVRWYAEQVMTDNGAAYVSHRWRAAYRELEIRHLRTRAYTPRTNGKAERLTGTMAARLGPRLRLPLLRAPRPGARRLAALVNRRRPHALLGGLPPASRVPHLRGLYR